MFMEAKYLSSLQTPQHFPTCFLSVIASTHVVLWIKHLLGIKRDFMLQDFHVSISMGVNKDLKVLNIASKSLSSLLYHGKCFASLTGTTVDPLL